MVNKTSGPPSGKTPPKKAAAKAPSIKTPSTKTSTAKTSAVKKKTVAKAPAKKAAKSAAGKFAIEKFAASQRLNCYSPIPGLSKMRIGLTYQCPKCDFIYRGRMAGETVPECPTHHVALLLKVSA